MTNFEKIKAMSVDALAEWLERLSKRYDEPDWTCWFDENYCKKCEPVIGRYKDSHREMEFSWCELNDNKCKYFQELDEIPDEKEIIKMWLESEV